jgi:hypothetical protein
MRLYVVHTQSHAEVRALDCIVLPARKVRQHARCVDRLNATCWPLVNNKRGAIESLSVYTKGRSVIIDKVRNNSGAFEGRTGGVLPSYGGAAA